MFIADAKGTVIPAVLVIYRETTVTTAWLVTEPTTEPQEGNES